MISSSNGMMMTREVTRTVAGPGAGSPPLPTEPTLWADVPLNVGGGDVADVAIPLRTGLRISGRVQFNGSAQPPTADQMGSIGIMLDPADGRTTALAGTVRGRVEPDGTFTTMGVPAGKYMIRVTAPGSWTLRSATANGQDIPDSPIELEQGDATGVVLSFTDRVASIAGTVTSAAGQGDGGASVMLFPVDRGAWVATGSSPRRLRNVRAGANGSFNISNVPPGEYFITAVNDAVAGDWPGPTFAALPEVRHPHQRLGRREEAADAHDGGGTMTPE